MKTTSSEPTTLATTGTGELRWPSDWAVAVQVWFERRGDTVLGEPLADVLAAIQRTNSISAAARAIGISYRHAWKLVQAGNDAAGEPLVAAAVGGIKGGGAQLTPRGQQALVVFEALREQVSGAAASLLQRRVHPGLNLAATIHLSAAVSLQEVIGQVLAEYALKQPGIRVRAVYGASNELADHVIAGAPCDVFVSADPVHLDRLAAERRLRAASRREVAVNSLVAVGSDATPAISSAHELIKARRVVLADPVSPLGKWSQAYLQKIGLADDLARKTMLVDNSGAIFAAIRAGRAEAGLAFASDLTKATGCRQLFAIDPADASVVYSAAACRGEREADSQALVEFLTSAMAQRCFRRCGFARPRSVSTRRGRT